MKKLITALCFALMLSALISSCAKGKELADDVSDMASELMEESKDYTLRLGIYQSHNASDGKAKFSSTFAAIICDENGVIVDCVIDATDDTASLDAGAVERRSSYPSKNEQGLEYGMKSASGIGKEWFEQAAFFADYVKGMKTEDAEDVDGDEAELTAGCTIDINGFKAAIHEALDNEEEAVRFESDRVPTVASAVVSRSDGSKNASSETDGVAVLTSVYAAVAKNGDKIAAANIDETESKIYFDEAGHINQLDYGDGKREEGDSYGMKASSAIGLEWYEQVRNFEKYIVGMTVGQVPLIDMSEGYATDEILKAGCTVKISEFVKAVAKTAG